MVVVVVMMMMVGALRRRRHLRYMGIGAQWETPTTSWKELNYTNLCVNACWELCVGPDRLV